MRFDGKQPPLGSDELCVSKQLRDRLAIERRRHHEDPQRLAQLRLHIERQRKSQVGMQTSLVELIEDHAAHPLERGVPLQPPGEDTFGHDFDTGPRPDARVGARAVANRLADALVERGRHARGHGARGDAAWLEHHDPFVAEPGGLEQRERHDRALACAGRCLEHCRGMRGQRRPQFRQRVLDRQVGKRGRPHARKCTGPPGGG